MAFMASIITETAFIPSSGLEEWQDFPSATTVISHLPRCPIFSFPWVDSPIITKSGLKKEDISLAQIPSNLSSSTTQATTILPGKSLPLKLEAPAIAAARPPFISLAPLP